MENGVENGALAEGEPVDEVGENQVVSSSDGEGDGDVDGDVEEEGQVLQQQPPPPPQSQPQITNDCEGSWKGSAHYPRRMQLIQTIRTPDHRPWIGRQHLSSPCWRITCATRMWTVMLPTTTTTMR